VLNQLAWVCVGGEAQWRLAEQYSKGELRGNYMPV
jgi:hypothetical protein